MARYNIIGTTKDGSRLIGWEDGKEQADRMASLYQVAYPEYKRVYTVKCAA